MMISPMVSFGLPRHFCITVLLYFIVIICILWLKKNRSTSKSDCGPVKLSGLSRNGPQKRTLTDELVSFNSTGSERSKFHYSEQKVTWSSLNVSPLLCGLYVYEA